MRSGCLTFADSTVPFSLFNPQSRIQSRQMLDLGKRLLRVSPKLFCFSQTAIVKKRFHISELNSVS